MDGIGMDLPMKFGAIETPLTPAEGSDTSDALLAAACVRGDTDAFERIYQREGARMKSVAFNHLGNRSEAEDAVQETFLKIHRNAKSWTGQASFSVWIYRILINTCHDLIRRRKRRPEESSLESETPSQGAADPWRRVALRKLLERLPEQRRTVLLLFEVEGLSHREIGEILNIQESYSKWLLFTTKRELQQMWRGTRET
ncbi:MAG TPA: RNA polymerase sigma factor, partial [Thermoanaerobaculia bacterium]|nr:RNA polymerase sigma factor [Thermoanaerobaculia bacterium]